MSGIRLPEQNQVLLTGRLTRDPEIFFTQGGLAKCSFAIAVNRNYRDKASGEWKELVSYIPVVVWRQAAERCKEKLRKGSPVHVEGRLQSRQFEDKSGQKRTILEVEARRVQFLAMSEGSGAAQSAPAAAGAEASEGSAGESEIEEVPF